MHPAFRDALKSSEFRLGSYGSFTHQESALDAFVHLSERRGVVVRAGGGHVISFWNDKRMGERIRGRNICITVIIIIITFIFMHLTSSKCFT